MLSSDKQGETNWVAANWNFGDDPCPIKNYEWTVHNSDGSVLRPTQTVTGRKLYPYFNGIVCVKTYIENNRMAIMSTKHFKV